MTVGPALTLVPTQALTLVPIQVLILDPIQVLILDPTPAPILDPIPAPILDPTAAAAKPRLAQFLVRSKNLGLPPIKLTPWPWVSPGPLLRRRCRR